MHIAFARAAWPPAVRITGVCMQRAVCVCPSARVRVCERAHHVLQVDGVQLAVLLQQQLRVHAPKGREEAGEQGDDGPQPGARG